MIQAAGLWRADRMDPPITPTATTGWPSLDAELPGGGWPLSGLTELLMTPASGEIALLAPWLSKAGLSGSQTLDLCCVAPPGTPCTAAFEAMGMPLRRWLWVTPSTALEAAWAAELALRAGSCAAVLWWPAQPVTPASLRRLHLASQAGHTPFFVLRPPAAHSVSSPAPLRLACTPQPGRRLAVEVFKRRGPPMSTPLTLTLPWPISARHRTAIANAHHALDCPAPAPVAAASPARIEARA